uniref:Antitoxin Phd_YefM, type II toxin-antitoxin system n=1 Tax=Candidatus Kentrum sp. DK TaxID=2126562 RepID=A0A450SRV1_9GAMM|nr:MAG: Antitoxin Phd_YefM, type II toxin-antitoxin system [Candidatus Kentron sp. DK]
MEEIQFSDLENNLNRIIQSVCRSDRPVLIADQKRPLVTIVPVSSSVADPWLGCMRNRGRIVGDIVSPAEDPGVWEVLPE